MIELRPVDRTDAEAIQRLADNPAIAANLRDAFPSPYRLEDAVVFLDLLAKGLLGHVSGIYAQDTLVGIASLIPQQDIYRMNAEIGYWIGAPYWGKGYATAAVRQMVDYAFGTMGLFRVYAGIFDYNLASMKVLEKVGFQKEAIIRSSVFKGGKLLDEHLYSIRKL